MATGSWNWRRSPITRWCRRQSLLRSTWHLEQPGYGEMIGRESNMVVAILRRFVDSLSWLPYHFDFVLNGRPAFSVVKKWGLRDKYVVTIHDPHGCVFDETEEDLIGREGWAAYMQPIDCENAGPAHDCDYDEEVGPQWEAMFLCCPTPECTEPP